MRIFLIGFSKCGTSSIHERLLALGFRSVHHTCPKTGWPIALVIKDNIDNGRCPLFGLDMYDAFTDLVYLTEDTHIEAFRFYGYFQESISDAYFILNVRDRQRWVESCARHPRLFERLMKVYGFKSVDALVEKLLTDWDEHIEKVIAEIPSERLLLYDIERDDARKIDRFLGVEVGLSVRLGHANYTPGVAHTLMRKIVPRAFRDVVPTGLKARLGYALRKR